MKIGYSIKDIIIRKKVVFYWLEIEESKNILSPSFLEGFPSICTG